MGRKRPRLRYRQLRKILESFGFIEVKSRGKGSHRMFKGRDASGKRHAYPVKCHNENQELNIAVVNAARRVLGLTPDDDVSDEDFYGRS